MVGLSYHAWHAAHARTTAARYGSLSATCKMRPCRQLPTLTWPGSVLRRMVGTSVCCEGSHTPTPPSLACLIGCWWAMMIRTSLCRIWFPSSGIVHVPSCGLLVSCCFRTTQPIRREWGHGRMGANVPEQKGGPPCPSTRRPRTVKIRIRKNAQVHGATPEQRGEVQQRSAKYVPRNDDRKLAILLRFICCLPPSQGACSLPQELPVGRASPTPSPPSEGVSLCSVLHTKTATHVLPLFSPPPPPPHPAGNAWFLYPTLIAGFWLTATDCDCLTHCSQT